MAPAPTIEKVKTVSSGVLVALANGGDIKAALTLSTRAGNNARKVRSRHKDSLEDFKDEIAEHQLMSEHWKAVAVKLESEKLGGDRTRFSAIDVNLIQKDQLSDEQKSLESNHELPHNANAMKRKSTAISESAQSGESPMQEGSSESIRPTRQPKRMYYSFPFFMQYV